MHKLIVIVYFQTGKKKISLNVFVLYLQRLEGEQVKKRKKRSEKQYKSKQHFCCFSVCDKMSSFSSQILPGLLYRFFAFPLYCHGCLRGFQSLRHVFVCVYLFYPFIPPISALEICWSKVRSKIKELKQEITFCLLSVRYC